MREVEKGSRERIEKEKATKWNSEDNLKRGGGSKRNKQFHMEVTQGSHKCISW